MEFSVPRLPVLPISMLLVAMLALAVAFAATSPAPGLRVARADIDSAAAPSAEPRCSVVTLPRAGRIVRCVPPR